jgi:hypothetical protein
MTIRFAAAQRGESAVVARALSATVPLIAANDNSSVFGRDRVLSAALRHFAAHGLGAAEHARGEAERAFFAGNRGQYEWWLAICRALDRRMADAVKAHGGLAGLN